MVVAIHRVRTSNGLPFEPVGVWEAVGAEIASYYPPGAQKYAARGERMIIERPVPSAEEWLHFKAQTSPAWRIHDPAASPFDFGTPGLEAIFDAVHAEYLQKVAAILGKADADRSRPKAAAPIVEVSGWGASRFVVAQSWWIAAELVRRHPELIVYEMHPGGGQYDVLCVASPEQLRPGGYGSLARVMLNRVGTLQVHSGTDAHPVCGWEDVLTAANPHVVIKQVEAAAGWEPPAADMPATPRSLAYAFFASALAMVMNDRHPWDVRSEFLDTSGYGGGPVGLITAFPAAVAELDAPPRAGIWGEPHSHFWSVRRGEHAVAIVSDGGRIYQASGGGRDLVAAHNAAGRRILPMTAALLRKWL